MLNHSLFEEEIKSFKGLSASEIMFLLFRPSKEDVLKTIHIQPERLNVETSKEDAIV